MSVVEEAMRGNADAYALVMLLDWIANTWDDLVDHDVEVFDAEVNVMMWRCMSEIPRNPFYREHFADLQPLIEAAMLSWRMATYVERCGEPSDLRWSYVIRSAYVDIVVACARIIGGDGYAVECGIRLHRWIHEDFDVYVAGLAVEAQKRKQAHGMGIERVE